MQRRVPLVVLLAPALLAACGDGGSDPPCCTAPPVDVTVAVGSAPGVVSFEERPSEPSVEAAGYRTYWIEFEQPADHGLPAGQAFLQFATLLWKDEHRPMVFGTNGYFADRTPGRSELAALLDANQLVVEHRFFEPSRPVPTDWSTLTIEQAAADHHAIVQSLRPRLGAGAWLSVGASKGGMTAVYHRRFHPDDVDGTLAYVAPQSFSRSDGAYVPFIEGVGGAAQAACRSNLETFQRALLERRDEIEPIMDDVASADGDAFTFFGTPTALEFAVVELSFAFWQYGTPAMCASIPAPDAAASQLFSFMNQVLGGVTSWLGDASLAHYSPYYYQSATQLGGPAYPQDHLLDLLPGGLPANDVPELYPPEGVTKTWDAAAMPDVGSWVSSEGERLLFIYGEYDPWSSNMFAPDEANDSWRFVVPAGNHSASVTRLPAAERAEATSILMGWAGLPAGALVSGEIPEFDPWVLLTGERGVPRDANSANPRGFPAPSLDGPPPGR